MPCFRVGRNVKKDYPYSLTDFQDSPSSRHSILISKQKSVNRSLSLIKSEGSGKPLTLISTKRSTPIGVNLSLAYSRVVKIYQISRIENKSVKLKFLCYV
jgi:hypothetical protein